MSHRQFSGGCNVVILTTPVDAGTAGVFLVKDIALSLLVAFVAVAASELIVRVWQAFTAW
jgi:hypothetical protein